MHFPVLDAIVALSSDWSIVLFASVVITQSQYFGIHFTAID